VPLTSYKFKRSATQIACNTSGWLVPMDHAKRSSTGFLFRQSKSRIRHPEWLRAGTYERRAVFRFTGCSCRPGNHAQALSERATGARRHDPASPAPKNPLTQRSRPNGGRGTPEQTGYPGEHIHRRSRQAPCRRTTTKPSRLKRTKGARLRTFIDHQTHRVLGAGRYRPEQKPDVCPVDGPCASDSTIF